MPEQNEETEALHRQPAIEKGPVVHVLPASLLECGHQRKMDVRLAAWALLGISLINSYTLQGIVGTISAAVFLCSTKGSHTVRTVSHRARWLRAATCIVAALAFAGSVVQVGIAAVYIPRMGAKAEADCIAQRHAHQRHPQEVSAYYVPSCTGVFVEVSQLEEAPSRVATTDHFLWALAAGDSLVRPFVPAPEARGPSQSQHQTCHQVGSSLKIVGALGLLIMLALSLALGVVAVRTCLAARALVTFVNAAGPNAM